MTTDAVLLQNASATLNDNISRTALTELPLPRRDFSNLLSLQNGVRYDTGGMFSINGLATGGISVTVDGVDASGDPETKSIASFQGYNQINVHQPGGDSGSHRLQRRDVGRNRRALTAATST